MDDLAVAAVEEVALEGRGGCSIDRLWTLLKERMPVAGFTCLNEEIKLALWEALKARPAEIEFCLPGNPTE